MRSSHVLLSLALALIVPGVSHAQSGEREQLELHGLIYGGYSHSFQDTDVPGGSFNDGNGSELGVGIQTGDYVQFLASWEWQGESDYDTHFIPLSVRMLSPSLLDRMHLYGEFGIGLFFSRLHNEFNVGDDDNERGSAVRLRAGVEVGITEEVSAIAYWGYLWGLGSTDDYEYSTVGLGLQYSWGL